MMTADLLSAEYHVHVACLAALPFTCPSLLYPFVDEELVFIRAIVNHLLSKRPPLVSEGGPS